MQVQIQARDYVGVGFGLVRVAMSETHTEYLISMQTYAPTHCVTC